MKKQMVKVLLMAITGVMLMGCSKKESTEVTKLEIIPTESEQDSSQNSEDAENEADTENADAATDEVDYVEYGYMAYDDLIIDVENLMLQIKSGSDVDSMEELERLNISQVYHYAQDNMGYVKEDIDNDGIDELIFGEDPYSAGDGTVIYDMFTVDTQGNMIQLLSGGERDRFYLCQGGILYEEGSSGADDSFEKFWKIENKKLVESDAPAGNTYMNLNLSYFNEGKALTMGDVSDEAAEGIAANTVYPNVYLGDYEDGIFPVAFDISKIEETEEYLLIKDAELYIKDTYDIVDIANLGEGKSIVAGGIMYEVKSVERSGNFVLINGGEEEGGLDLRAVEEDNCYVVCGMSDAATYTLEDTMNLVVSDKVKYEDLSNPGNDITATIDNLYQTIMDSENTVYNPYNATVRLENGEVVEITRNYMP